MPNGGERAAGQIEPTIDREALYRKFMDFVEQVMGSQAWKGWFSAGDKDAEGFQAALNGWFTTAEQEALIEEAKTLAPDQPPGALGYWIW